MDDSLAVIFATIVAILLMFIFPLMDTWERQDDLSYMLAYSVVVDFVDTVRNTGYMTESMITEFEEQLAATGNRFEIQYEHREIVYMPVTDAGNTDYKTGYLYHFNKDIEDAMKKDANDYAVANPSVTDYDPRYANFEKGDYFFVSIKNTNKTQATVVKEFLYASTMETFKIGVPYGGMVRNSVEYD